MVASVDEWLRTFVHPFVENGIEKPKAKSKNQAKATSPIDTAVVSTGESTNDTAATSSIEEKKTFWQQLSHTLENMEEKSSKPGSPRQEYPERHNYQYNSIKFLMDSKNGKLFSTEHLFSQNIFQKSCTNVTNFSKALLKRILHKSTYVKLHNTVYTWGGLTSNGIINELITLELDKMKLSPKRQDNKISERIFHSFDFVVHSNVFVIIGGIDKRGNILSGKKFCI